MEYNMAGNKICDFIDDLSSKKAVPGGGGASALAGALGMALGSMVAELTTGKKKYAQYQAEIDELISKMSTLTKELEECIDKDAKSFEPLSKAYGLPKETEEEIKLRNEVMEKALKDACVVPLEIMEKVLQSMKYLERLSVIGSRLAVSDVGVGIQMAKAALNGASLNVFINTGLMKDEETAAEFNMRADEMLVNGNEMADRIFEDVMDAVRK